MVIETRRSNKDSQQQLFCNSSPLIWKLGLVPESFIISDCLQWLPSPGEVDCVPPPTPSHFWFVYGHVASAAKTCDALLHVLVSSSTEPFFLHSQFDPPPSSLSHSLIPSLFLLLVLSIALLLLSPLSLGPGHMQEGRPGRCSSGKKKARGKCSAAISTGRPSPLASLCQKREGFYYSQSRILTLCLL